MQCWRRGLGTREKPRAWRKAPTSRRAHYTPAAADSSSRKEECYAVQIVPPGAARMGGRADPCGDPRVSARTGEP